MTPDDVEASWRRFRDGDADALADVFDATAPRLYRVALHLRATSWAAEDLVQTTFVTAIEKAVSFEPGRPVYPWLLGILTRHASELHRRERRRPPERDLVARATPLDRAESEEVHRQVRGAIAGLPEPYRTVVGRFVVTGHSPRQISLDLGRSPDTVRSQLKRGLAFVRGAIPRGLVPAAAVLQLPERGMATVRAEVLLRAHAGVGVAAPVLAGLPAAVVGVAAMVALLLVGASVWQASPDPIAPVVRSVATSLEPSLEGPVGAAQLSAGTRAPAARRAAVAVGPTRNVGGPAPTATLRGRVVDATTGAPLAGVAVDWLSLRDMVAADPGAARARATLGTHTDDLGRFALVLDAAASGAGHQLRIDGSPGDRVTARINRDYVAPDDDIDFGDVALAPGRFVSGTVREVGGDAVRSGSVRIGERLAIVRDGRFRSHDPIAFGRWPVTVHAPGVAPVAIATVTVSEHVRPLELVVPARRSIRGVLRDDSGRAIDGAVVAAEGGTADGVAFTDGRGRFELFAAHDRPAGESAALVFASWRVQPTGAPVVARWGAADVHLVGLACRTMRLEVRRRDGAPVLAFGVRCVPTDAAAARCDGLPYRHLTARGVQQRGVHAQGRLEVTGLWPGTFRVEVVPDDPELHLAEPLTVRVAPGDPIECVAVLDRRPVVAPEPLPPPAHLCGRVLEPGAVHALHLRRVDAAEPSEPLLLALGAGGQFARDDVPAGRYQLLGVHRQCSHRPGIYEEHTIELEPPLALVTLEPGAATRLELASGTVQSGRLRGTLEHGWVPRSPSWLYLAPADEGAGVGGEQRSGARIRDHEGGRDAGSWSGPHPVDADGRFDVRDVLPGRYRLVWSSHGARFAVDTATIALEGTVAVAPGEVAFADRVLSGRPLRLQLLAAGGDAVRGPVRLVRDGVELRANLGADGVAWFAHVPPGELCVVLERARDAAIPSIQVPDAPHPLERTRRLKSRLPSRLQSR